MQAFTDAAMKKIHSLYFPIDWREATTSIPRILMLTAKDGLTKESLKSMILLLIGVFRV